MTKTTGLEMMERHNLRQNRARALTATILQRLDGLLDKANHTVRRDAHEALMTLFMQQGVEVITDYQRAEIGLPPRTDDGWTEQEIMALEQSRLAMLLRPISCPPLPSPKGIDDGVS